MFWRGGGPRPGNGLIIGNVPPAQIATAIDAEQNRATSLGDPGIEAQKLPPEPRPEQDVDMSIKTGACGWGHADMIAAQARPGTSFAALATTASSDRLCDRPEMGISMRSMRWALVQYAA